ncbi:hypothetical protein OG897_27340 [Streptomyces sp. NBC_00237]|uniref:hypothetical protein n=1 Tax=Streptomyces sp. NBC_00237 TaxID=2975687 RepID=UPI002256AD98|nr:hypothetical protein [Streptomyces sp. NBC_00237]MCX5205158.1 hypothetical protein [Streptomyces sp. NBC_00237]
MSTRAYVTYPGTCPDCGADAEWRGAQLLLDGADALCWDSDLQCPACGLALTACGGDELPLGVRELLLTAHGRATVRVGPEARSAVVMRVLRASLTLDLVSVRSVLAEVRRGTYVCTLPEAELLARWMRAAGVEAVAEWLADVRT